MSLCELGIRMGRRNVRVYIRGLKINGDYVISMYSDGNVYVYSYEYRRSGVKRLEL